MKSMLKRISSLALAVLLVLALGVPAFAADTAVTYTDDGFQFGTGSNTYTKTDLFDNFKTVMPGDSLTQNIEIRNTAKNCDYINVYLRAEVHDEEGNPLTVDSDETVATMQDFLKQLTMRIYNGTELIYESTPDQAGALAENVLLGKLLTGESLKLKVELDVPMDLGNEYAFRTGEVDWVFLAEAIEFGKLTVHKVWDDNGDPARPDSVEVNLFKNGEIAETVKLSAENQWSYSWDDLDDRYQWSVEEIVPEGYEASYKLEDNTVFITNHNDYEPEVEPDPVDLTVKKVWSGDEEKLDKRPDSVTVTLYNGDKAVEKVVLSAANNWTYSWKGLDGHGDWSVLETGIPVGYAPTYRTSGGVVIINNVAKLIQTGQLNWPIPVLGGLGIALVLFGGVTMRRKKNGNA